MIDCGDIYWAEVTSSGRRPVVILSREELNRGGWLLADLCTSSRFATRRHLPNCLPILAGQFGLPTDCVIQGENLFALERTQFDLSSGPIGRLDDVTYRSLVKAIGHVMKSDCEPT